MECESCHHREASVHVTQMINGVTKQVHLCEECAAKNGLNMTGPMSITDLLMGIGEAKKESPNLPPLASSLGKESEEKTCPICGMSMKDIKKGGRLGCDHCYDVFAMEIVPVISSLHRGDLHQGKIPKRASAHIRASVELGRLRLELDKAVVSENFEEAARIRDRIHECQATMDDDPPSGPEKSPHA